MRVPPPVVTVRGRCACGRRFRIRNARAGLGVACPNCQRIIQLSDIDIRAALGGDDDRIIGLKPDEVELIEAIPVTRGARLRLASEGSRPGLTGHRAFEHEEAQVVSALSPQNFNNPTATPTPGATVALYSSDDPIPVRTFFDDLLASFYFAGYLSNALSLALSAAILAVPTVVLFIAPMNLMFMLGAIITLSMVIVAGFVLQFYWGVLECTVGNEDEIPWVQERFDLMEDILRPAFWLAVLSVECTAPAIIGTIISQKMAAAPLPVWAGIALLALGWFFWPVGVMSVALGRTVYFLRPDWLVRCVIGIGPSYLVACMVIALTIAGWWSVGYVRDQLNNLYAVVGPNWQWALMIAYIPLITVLFTINLYFGYVLFRTLGLLFRHFRRRLPWRM